MLSCSFSVHDGYHDNFRKGKFWTTQENIPSGSLSTDYFSYLIPNTVYTTTSEESKKPLDFKTI